MAITFPLSATDFMGSLLISELRFDAPEQVEVNQTGGGEQLSAWLAPQLWAGEVQLGLMTTLEAAVAETLLDLLRVPGRSFMAYDTRRPAPYLDPTGSILGASTPTIHTLNVNNRDMRLTGLPAGYTLVSGDYLAFTYAGRSALHCVVPTTVVASGAGTTPLFEVYPAIRAGATTGLAVTLIKPACKAVIVPGTVDKGRSTRQSNAGMRFQFRQTLG